MPKQPFSWTKLNYKRKDYVKNEPKRSKNISYNEAELILSRYRIKGQIMIMDYIKKMKSAGAY